MARYFDIHAANPQRRAIVQIADIVRAGGVIAYPTDSCYALGCQLGITITGGQHGPVAGMASLTCCTAAKRTTRQCILLPSPPRSAPRQVRLMPR